MTDLNRVCVINVVGLTPELLQHAPRLKQLSELPGYSCRAWASPTPAVTCTCQATMMTGHPPSGHGIVGNGWYFRDTQEIRFWQQSNALIQGPKFYDRYETAKMFWWFNQSSTAKYSATPKPHYGSDGSKVFDIIDDTGCSLTSRLGPFPFFSFWGPAAGLPSSRWIADATAIVLNEKKPQCTLAYLPHLDYDFQRLPNPDPGIIEEVDSCAATIVEAANAVGVKPIIVSEYGLQPVSKPVHINRVMRQSGLLAVRNGPFGEMLIPGTSKAFAVADHQVAHVYVNDKSNTPMIRRLLDSEPGIAAIVDPAEIGLQHERSGDLIALAAPDSWFTYYYWLQDNDAPDFARTVDIHRKPGYDPCELFKTSSLRAVARVIQKKLGFRYRMDMIPLDATLVRGSHGLQPDDSSKGPLIIGPGDLPSTMDGFSDYIHQLMSST